VRWHKLWEGNPAILRPEDLAAGYAPFEQIRNGEGCRPYIRYPFTAQRGMKFTDWRARDHVGTLYLTEDELAPGLRLREAIGPYLILEPDVKPASTPNKSWGLEKFADVVKALPDLTFLRTHGQECPPFPSVRNIQTRCFRDACGYLAASEGYVGTEGGYHHAAAALGKPAVVIFGGFISPKTTGYDGHVNLCDKGNESPCGRWQPCSHCRSAMDRITVEHVVHEVRELFCQRMEQAS
jgi:ADP-heptose:LPS heptosyltransferase